MKQTPFLLAALIAASSFCAVAQPASAPTNNFKVEVLTPNVSVVKLGLATDPIHVSRYLYDSIAQCRREPGAALVSLKSEDYKSGFSFTATALQPSGETWTITVEQRSKPVVTSKVDFGNNCIFQNVTQNNQTRDITVKLGESRTVDGITVLVTRASQ